MDSSDYQAGSEAELSTTGANTSQGMWVSFRQACVNRLG